MNWMVITYARKMVVKIVEGEEKAPRGRFI
jgi:hypothetical protein